MTESSENVGAAQKHKHKVFPLFATVGDATELLPMYALWMYRHACSPQTHVASGDNARGTTGTSRKPSGWTGLHGRNRFKLNKKKQSLADAQAQNCSGRFDRPPEEQWSLGVGSGRGQFSRLPSEHRAAAFWELNKKKNNIFTYTSLWMTFPQTQFSGGSEWWSESVGFGEISLLWDNSRAAQRTKSESDY